MRNKSDEPSRHGRFPDGHGVVLRALLVRIVILNNVKNILILRRVYQNINTFAIVIPVSLILGKPYQENRHTFAPSKGNRRQSK